MKTMDDKYGDGSEHEVCPDCGFCIPCGDCNLFGCGKDLPENIEKRRIWREIVDREFEEARRRMK